MSVAIPEDGSPMRGRLAGIASGSPPRRVEADRVCGEPSCTTLLSVYNSGAFCWQHADRSPYYLRAPRKRRTAA